MFETHGEHAAVYQGEEERAGLVRAVARQDEEIAHVPITAGAVEVTGDRTVRYRGPEGWWAVEDGCAPVWTGSGTGKAIEMDFTVTPGGLAGLCAKIGVPRELLKRLDERGLASRVLNDRLRAHATVPERAELRLVVERDARRVVGVVSDRYAHCTNGSVLEALEDAAGAGFAFHNAVLDGTRLVARYAPREGDGRWRWGGGRDGDSWIGLEARNDMVGSGAVRLGYHVSRLVCSNGMTIRAGGRAYRVVHRKGATPHGERLKEAVADARAWRPKMQDALDRLAGRTYAVPVVARSREWREEIWPALPAKVREAARRNPRDLKPAEREEAKLTQATTLVAQAQRAPEPKTVFDWMNLMTALARRLPARERLALEAGVGSLANRLMAAEGLTPAA